MRRALHRLLILGALALALLAAALLGRPARAAVVLRVARPAPAAAGSVIYPVQALPLRFSHARHGTVACLDCHAAAATSASATDRLLPGEAVCARCHPVDRREPARVVAGQPAAACVACHPDYRDGLPVARVQILTPNLKFSHAAHATAACATCHAGAATAEVSSAALLPTMATCVTCHDGAAAPSACGTCHLQAVGGGLRTTFFEGELRPTATSSTSVLGAVDDAHDADFMQRHGKVASSAGAACGACHEARYCADCHQGQISERAFHRPGYAAAHAEEARRGVPDCTVCHRTQSFCVGCHERQGLGTRAGSEFVSGDPERSFHPRGWASTSIAEPNLHAAEARRNLPSCSSCHREDDCLTCHSAQPGIARISPHPRGWRGSAACRAMDTRNRRVCLRCHITEDELGCDWQGLEPTP